MRELKAISPTSLFQWERDKDDFYRKYLSDYRAPYDPQSRPASVGSAFDAFVKCALHHHIFGNDGDGVYELKRLFNEQVDEANREWAWGAGKYCFDCYRTWGIYDALLQELLRSEEDPRFEFKLTGDVKGVPLVGKPDLWYKLDVQVVYDWKVMGYCSKSPQSPKKFYRSCIDCWEPTKTRKATRGGGHSKPHPKFEEMDHKGHKIGAHWMEDVDKKWADQITIYSWLMGMEVGDEDTIVGIDQLACKPNPDKIAQDKMLVENKDSDEVIEVQDFKPLIRVAQHRCRVSEFWQHSLMNRITSMWETVHSGHIFTELSREDSDKRCQVMDIPPPNDGNDDFWAMCNERPFRG